jgi:hypothetical protein
MADSEGALRDLHEALGELVIASSAVEEILHDGIVYLSGELSDTQRLSVANSPLGNLIDMFEARYLKRAAKTEGLPPVADLCTLFRRLSKERNDLLHAMWTFDSESGVARRYRTKTEGGGLRLDVQSVYPDSVRDLASRLHGAEDKLYEIMVQVFSPSRSSV